MLYSALISGWGKSEDVFQEHFQTPKSPSMRLHGEYPNPPISSIEFLNCNNSRDNYTMCSVQQEHQTGAHSMIRDRTYRPVLVSYIIPRVIRNSLISRVRPCLMLLLNTTHRVVAIRICVLEKRGDWNGRIRLYPPKSKREEAATLLPFATQRRTMPSESAIRCVNQWAICHTHEA